MGFPGGSKDKASACNTGDLGLNPGSRRSPGEGNGNPLQYSCLENPMDGEAWQATAHGVAKSRTRLGDFTFTYIYIYVCVRGYIYVCVCFPYHFYIIHKRQKCSKVLPFISSFSLFLDFSPYLSPNTFRISTIVPMQLTPQYLSIVLFPFQAPVLNFSFQ